MAIAAKKFGYTGIFVTDHNWGGNCTVPRETPWEEWVTEYIKGYEHAAACGKRIGLDVFFAYEASHNGHDFLIYGVDPAWMIAHPRLRIADIQEQYRMIHAAGGMVIQAHPFREASYIPQVEVYPEDVDGVEILNASHSNHKFADGRSMEFDRKAIRYAAQYQLPPTAGSDIHWTDLPGGGMAFRRRIESALDYGKAVLNDEDYILTNGDYWY